MADHVSGFFAAWSEPDESRRREMIEGAFTANFIYSDPRTDGRIVEMDALVGYVGQFTATADGMVAEVLKKDERHGYLRALVGFGKDGQHFQHGTYFGELDSTGRVLSLVGFVGTGAPE